MKFSVKVESLRDLVDVAGLTTGALARRLGLSESMTALKVKGIRPFFADELGAIVGAVEETGRFTITETQVIKLIGKQNIKVRGFIT